MFSDETKKFIKKESERYETKRSAIMPCLYRIQGESEGNWVSPQAITELSNLMEIPQAWINEILSFYTMFNQKPIGKLHVQVCTNITCSMKGGRELIGALEKEFDTKIGETSKDQKITLSCVECLGSCDTAPMMQVGDEYYENLTTDSAVKILKGLGEQLHGV